MSVDRAMNAIRNLKRIAKEVAVKKRQRRRRKIAVRFVVFSVFMLLVGVVLWFVL